MFDKNSSFFESKGYYNDSQKKELDYGDFIETSTNEKEDKIWQYIRTGEDGSLDDICYNEYPAIHSSFYEEFCSGNEYDKNYVDFQNDPTFLGEYYLEGVSEAIFNEQEDKIFQYIRTEKDGSLEDICNMEYTMEQRSYYEEFNFKGKYRENHVDVLNSKNFLKEMDFEDVNEISSKEQEDKILQYIKTEEDGSLDDICNMEYSEKRVSFFKVIDIESEQVENQVDVPIGQTSSVTLCMSDICTIVYELLKRHIIIFCSGMLYYYNGMIMKGLDKLSFRTFAIQYIKKDITIHMSRNKYTELYERLMVEPSIQFDINNVERNKNYFCLRNGVYDVCNGKLLPHDASFYFFTNIDVDYKDQLSYKEGKVFEKYLDTISGGIDCIRQRMLEVMALCISDYRNLKVIPLLLGDKDSGKTTFANLLSILVSKENAGAINLLAIDKWTRASCHGKKICLSTDLTNTTINSKAVSFLKEMSGGDLIMGERKGENPFFFYSTCIIILASNYVPVVADRDKALKNRWLIIPFLNPLDKNDINPKLLEELKKELPYIVRVCAKTLTNLYYNDLNLTPIGEYANYFEQGGTYLDLHQDEVVQKFIENKCVISPDEKTTSANLYNHYKSYCMNEFNLPPIANTVFARKLRKILGSQVRDGRHSNGRSLVGIGVKQEEDVKYTWM